MDSTIYSKRIGVINLCVLAIAIGYVLFLSPCKKIWYDESVSILCSKGFAHNTHVAYDSLSSFTSAQLQLLNKPAEVFNATVVDNSNSFLYNISLYWYTLLAGNSISSYMLFSKLLAICTLVAFFLFSRKLLGNTLFVAVAIFFLTADPVFSGMATEIRAYMMGMLFTCLAGICFYKYLYEEDTPFNLFCFSLFAVCMLLSHYLSAYIILTAGLILLLKKGLMLFKGKNLIAIGIPLLLFGGFLLLAADGFKVMDNQNGKIATKAVSTFSYGNVAFSFMKFTAINFKAVFPAFLQIKLLQLISFLFVVAAYITGRKMATDDENRSRVDMLFILGICSSFFMAILSIYVKHTTPFYNRYFSFSVPFCCLFAAMFLQLLFSIKGKAIIKYGVLIMLIIPVTYLAYSNLQIPPELKYSHVDVAELIEKEDLTDVEVPVCQDAFLINSFLQNDRKIVYHIIPGATKFAVYKGSAKYYIEVVRNDI